MQPNSWQTVTLPQQSSHWGLVSHVDLLALLVQRPSSQRKAGKFHSSLTVKRTGEENDKEFDFCFLCFSQTEGLSRSSIEKWKELAPARRKRVSRCDALLWRFIPFSLHLFHTFLVLLIFYYQKESRLFVAQVSVMICEKLIWRHLEVLHHGSIDRVEKVEIISLQECPFFIITSK